MLSCVGCNGWLNQRINTAERAVEASRLCSRSSSGITTLYVVKSRMMDKVRLFLSCKCALNVCARHSRIQPEFLAEHYRHRTTGSFPFASIHVSPSLLCSGPRLVHGYDRVQHRVWQRHRNARRNRARRPTSQLRIRLGHAQGVRYRE